MNTKKINELPKYNVLLDKNKIQDFIVDVQDANNQRTTKSIDLAQLIEILEIPSEFNIVVNETKIEGGGDGKILFNNLGAVKEVPGLSYLLSKNIFEYNDSQRGLGFLLGEIEVTPIVKAPVSIIRGDGGDFMCGYIDASDFASKKAGVLGFDMLNTSFGLSVMKNNGVVNINMIANGDFLYNAQSGLNNSYEILLGNENASQAPFRIRGETNDGAYGLTFDKSEFKIYDGGYNDVFNININKHQIKINSQFILNSNEPFGKPVSYGGTVNNLIDALVSVGIFTLE